MKKILILILTLGTLAAVAADDAPQLTAPLFYSPQYFRNAFVRPVKYSLEAPGSIKDLVQNGKLTLSVRDVARLVVQRNTAVWLARMDVAASATPVLRAYGPFDPRFSSSFSSSRAISPTASKLDASSQLSQQANFSYNQAFASGTAYSVGFNGFKSSSNNSFVFLNPSIRAGLNIGLSQPLLRDRGFFAQRAPIVIARINQQISKNTFEQRLTDQLQSTLGQYWDTVQAREALVVAHSALTLAEKSYDHDKRSLELGALPPLDIYRSEAEVANRKVQVTTAEYQLRQQEDALRRMIAADLDPAVRDLPLDLTDSPTPPAKLEEADQPQAIDLALRKRPELEGLHRQQAIDSVSIRLAQNSLKPDLRLGGNYSSNGLGGNLFDSNGLLVNTGGLSDALSQLFNFNNPTYGFSLSLNFPIKSRQAQADMASAAITQRKNMYQERDLQQQIVLDVRNAINRLEQSKANIAGSTAARDLARKNLEAEQRKYDLGASTIFFVLDAQQRLSDAETQLLGADIAYRKAVLALQRATASLLPEYQIVLDDAAAMK